MLLLINEIDFKALGPFNDVDGTVVKLFLAMFKSYRRVEKWIPVNKIENVSAVRIVELSSETLYYAFPIKIKTKTLFVFMCVYVYVIHMWKWIEPKLFSCRSDL